MQLTHAADAEAFAERLERLAGAAITAEHPLAVAVSGGADSMALLALALRARPEGVIAATVDHRLRTAAADEAALVARWCAANRVPHSTLPVDVVDSGNRQALARAARYAALAHWAVGGGAVALATAHHADDQAETFLMRAVRGGGVAGLAGIRPTRIEPASAGGGIRVIRPLLDERRAALRGHAVAAGVPFVDDPSNDDPRYERTRVRALLAATPWLDAAALARAAAHLGEVDRDLGELAATFWGERARQVGGEISIDMAGLPRELRRRLTRRALATLSGTGPDLVNVEPMLDALEAGRGASQMGVMAEANGLWWRFRPAPPRRPH